MPQTSVSGLTAYCTGSQFVSFYDARTTAQLLSDTDIPIALTLVASNTTLANLLQTASGELESIALMGGRYLTADLQALTGNAALFLAWLVAALTVPLLKQRRPELPADDFPQMKKAEAFLAALEEGKAIFPTAEAQTAGTMEDQIEVAQDVENRALVTWRAERLFGRRNNRIDP